jgi:hypothetical protein
MLYSQPILHVCTGFKPMGGYVNFRKLFTGCFMSIWKKNFFLDVNVLMHFLVPFGEVMIPEK